MSNIDSARQVAEYHLRTVCVRYRAHLTNLETRAAAVNEQIERATADIEALILAAKKEAWDEGRESLALDAMRPLDATCMRPTTKNPYAA